MKKRKNLFRIVAVVLTMTIMFSICSISVFADVTLPSSVSYVQPGKTYFIRCHLSTGYLYAPSGVSAGSPPGIGECSYSSTRYQWKVVTSDVSGYYYLQNVAYPSLYLSLDGNDGVSVLLRTSSFATNNRWRLTIQTSEARFGTYRIANYSNTSKVLTDVETSNNRAQVLALTDNGYASWIFEEVLSSRNNAAPPVSHNYTVATTGYYEGHEGRDVAPTTYTSYNYPVYADRSGYVSYWSSIVNNKLTRIGNFATLKHDDGSGALYAHLELFYFDISAPSLSNELGSSVSYNPIKQHSGSVYVKRGQLIGFLGNTGNSYGNHVHMEYYTNYSAVWDGSATWDDSSAHDTYVRDPKDYMKLWWT